MVSTLQECIPVLCGNPGTPDMSDFVRSTIEGIFDELRQHAATVVGLCLESKGYENNKKTWQRMSAVMVKAFDKTITDYYVEESNKESAFICRTTVEIVENKINFSYTLEK